MKISKGTLVVYYNKYKSIELLFSNDARNFLEITKHTIHLSNDENYDGTLQDGDKGISIIDLYGKIDSHNKYKIFSYEY